MRICLGMYIFNIGPRAILASLWQRALLEILPADWMRASRDAHCFPGALSQVRAQARGSVDTIVTYKQ